MIRRELGIWSRLSHRNIVPFLGITHGFGKQGSASLVSMWMPYGTLHTFLEAHDDRLAVPHRLQLASKTNEDTTERCLTSLLRFSCWMLRMDSIIVGFHFTRHNHRSSRTVHSFPMIHGDLSSVRRKREMFCLVNSATDRTTYSSITITMLA
jgi:serine/threonine protein kinase